MRRLNKLSKLVVLLSLILVLVPASSSLAKMTDPPPPPDISNSQFNPDLGDDWDDDNGVSGRSESFLVIVLILKTLIWRIL